MRNRRNHGQTIRSLRSGHGLAVPPGSIAAILSDTLLMGVVLMAAAGIAGCQRQVVPSETVAGSGVERMVSLAKFETYVFSSQPAWTGPVEIRDGIDLGSPGKRMFMMTARAPDGRHLVLVQSATYNRMLPKKIKDGAVVYTAPNGFKVWGGGPQKWYSKILLQSAHYELKDPPAKDRTGYVLESPAGTFPALAVNGPISDAELHALVDSLTPARACLSGQADSPDQK